MLERVADDFRSYPEEQTFSVSLGRSQKCHEATWAAIKIATARFYAEHVLPEATGAPDEITTGAGSTLAVEEMSF